MSRTRTVIRSRRAGPVLPLAILLASASLVGCGRHSDSLQLGLKKISLDLSFKSAKKPPPPLAAIAAAPQMTPSVVVASGTLPTAPPIPATPNVPIESPTSPFGFTCPTAPANALPAMAAPVFITTPPTLGVYYMHNQGTFKLDGTLKLSGTYPPRTDQSIANVNVQETKDLLGNPNGRTITYDVIQRSPLSTVTTTYRAVTTTGSGGLNELDLVKVRTKTSQVDISFSPVPAVTMMQFKGEGANWYSGGIDPSNGTVMYVQGKIEKKETVDVCGTLVDTFRVVSTEQVTNVALGYTSKTDAADPNVYNVATQYGGLMVRQHENTTTTFTVSGVPFILNVNVTSTNDSVNPLPPGTPAPPPF